MATVDPGYSLAAVLRDYHPHPGWRNWFAEAYAGAIEGEGLVGPGVQLCDLRIRDREAAERVLQLG
ncbi:MAG: hypothetical protein J0H57_17710, partial [Rhodospirillales bacterium]|nr:hypothetical protein [Rhodospirillales bacterium]